MGVGQLHLLQYFMGVSQNRYSNKDGGGGGGGEGGEYQS